MNILPLPSSLRHNGNSYKPGDNRAALSNAHLFPALTSYTRRNAAIIRDLAATTLLLFLSIIAYSQLQALRSGHPILLHFPSRAISQHPTMFIGIKSAPLPKYRRRRDKWRRSPCAQRYRNAGIQYRFFVGKPLMSGDDRTRHKQGATDPLEIRKAEIALQAESDEFGDIEMLAMRDTHIDLSNKLLAILRYGFRNSRAEYIAVIHDEYCMDLNVTFSLIREYEDEADEMPESELYAGTYQYRGNEHESMKGANGESAPFMSGSCTIFSRGLLKFILQTDWMHTALFSVYGTSSDDANSGKWVKYAREKHGLRVALRSSQMTERVEDMRMSSNSSGVDILRGHVGATGIG